MRSGLPIVASDVAGVNEMVRDGINGYLIPRKDIKTLSERLELLINDKELRSRMAEQSLKEYKKAFTLDKTFENTYAL